MDDKLDMQENDHTTDEDGSEDTSQVTDEADSQDELQESDDSLNLTTDDFDVDAALASVSDLSGLMMDDDTVDDEREYGDDERRPSSVTVSEVAQEQPIINRSSLARPPQFELHRGQMASVVPALVLMALGAWLTFIFATAENVPTPGIIALVVMAGLGVILLSQWFSTGRWASGSLFGGLALLFTSGMLFYLTQDMGVDGWPLIIAALGVAIVLSELLSGVSIRGLQMMSGIALIIAGLAGLVVTLDVLSVEILDALQTVGPVILVVVAVLLVSPMLFRKRN